MYEGLSNRERDFTLEPSLAVGVGTNGRRAAPALPAAPERVLSRRRAAPVRGIVAARKTDPLTADVLLAAPGAFLPEKLWVIAMIGTPWTDQHGVTLPRNSIAEQETYAVRNANGAGCGPTETASGSPYAE